MISKLFKIKTNKIIVLFICILLVISVTACKSEESEEIVAKVNDIVITKDELYNLLVEQYGTQALDSLIGEKIVQLEIEKQKIEISDEEVETELNGIMEYYGGEKAFNEIMNYQGYTLDDMKDSITMNMQIKRLLEPTISISEEEIVNFFEQNKAYLDQKEQVKARHILVETEEQAKEIKGKIASGENFEELAKEYSMDDLSKELGGDLGFFGRGEMVPSFEEAAFSLDIGEVSNPIKSNYGYHIIMVDDKKQASEAKLEDHRDNIKNALIEEKMPEAYHEWYENKYKEYKVINNLEDNEN